MKKIINYVALLVFIVFAIMFYVEKNKQKDVVVAVPQESIDICYQYSGDVANGLVDRAWLKLSIIGDKVTGEYQNLPAETDSKVGDFAGSVGPMDPKIGGRVASVWWNSFAEGMNVTEELNIEFGEGSAVALFGEMVDRGDGVYVYKDISKLNPGFQMSQTDCESLDDKIIVEKYVRQNIKTVATKDPVLGGSWYVMFVSINPSMKTGLVTYEDGHIQGKSSFNYVRNEGDVSIVSVKSVE